MFAVQWVVSKDVCATAPTGAGAVTQPGPGTGVNPAAGAAPGNYCVAMWSQDRFDRLAGPTVGMGRDTFEFVRFVTEHGARLTDCQ